MVWEIFKKKKGNEKLNKFYKELYEKLFPEGEKQIKEEAKEIEVLLNGKLNSKEAYDILVKASAFFSIIGKTEENTEDRMIEYIAKITNQKLSKEECKATFNFINMLFVRKAHKKVADKYK